jgi:branched-chain amino acid aminotransferase
MSICYLEGAFRPTKECALPVTDLAITRGVGVFDSLRSFGGKPFALEEHMKRLEESALRIGIAVGDTVDRIKQSIADGLKRSDCPDGGSCVVKSYITGGDANDLGMFPNPRYFIIFDEAVPLADEEYRTGIALLPTPEARPYPTIKSINYLIGIMQSAGRPDVRECLYCPGGEITETLKSSFFAYIGGTLFTAPLGIVLEGVTRGFVIELARTYGFKVVERAPKLSDLADADEAFITGTLKDVLPVVRVGDTVIGSGKPGPVSARLLRLLREYRERRLANNN